MKYDSNYVDPMVESDPQDYDEDPQQWEEYRYNLNPWEETDGDNQWGDQEDAFQ